MAVQIEGAKLIGETWHFYKRIPKRLREAYALPEFKRGSMGTKDPDQARRLARAMLTELDELAARLDALPSRMRHFHALTEAKQNETLAEANAKIAGLPPDQRQLIQKAGGVFEGGRAMRRHELTAAFLTAGQGAEFDVKDDHGESYDPEEREEAEARDAASAAMHKRKGAALSEAFVAANVAERSGGVVTIREALDRYCAQKGFLHTDTRRDKTRGQYEYAVRRFAEFTGPVPLADLTRRHLADFAAAFLGLPISGVPSVRALSFRDAVKHAAAKGLPRVSPRTRDQNLVLLKAIMKYAVNEELRPAPDPWANYAPTSAKEKVADRRKRKTYVFSRDEMRAIIRHVSATRHHDTIDYWGPLLGAHHGLRIEEYCQARASDFSLEEGIFCFHVTDEGEDQSVKTSNSLRTIPIHPKLIELGFQDYVARRRAQGAGFLFLERQRWRDGLAEIKPNSYGRLAEAYGKRFRKHDLPAAGIAGHRVGSHSFRHGWTDLARAAGMNPEHRLALAGRDADSADRILDGTEKRYGHGFSIAALAQSLSLINIFD